MQLLLCALGAIAILPIVTLLITKANAEQLTLMLEHIENAARMGEPRELASERLALEAKKLELQHMLVQEQQARRASRAVVDVMS